MILSNAAQRAADSLAAEVLDKTVWLDPESMVDWETINAIKITQAGRAGKLRVAGSYDIWEQGNCRYEVVADEVTAPYEAAVVLTSKAIPPKAQDIPLVGDCEHCYCYHEGEECCACGEMIED